MERSLLYLRGVDTGRGTFATNYAVGVVGWIMSIGAVYAYQYLEAHKGLKRFCLVFGLMLLAAGASYFADGIAQDHTPDNTGVRVGWEIMSRVSTVLKGMFIGLLVAVSLELLPLQPGFAAFASAEGKGGALPFVNRVGSGRRLGAAAFRPAATPFDLLERKGPRLAGYCVSALVGLVAIILDVGNPNPEHTSLNIISAAAAMCLLIAAAVKTVSVPSSERALRFWLPFIASPILMIIGLVVQLALHSECDTFRAHRFGDCPLPDDFNHNAICNLLVAFALAVLIGPLLCLWSQVADVDSAFVSARRHVPPPTLSRAATSLPRLKTQQLEATTSGVEGQSPTSTGESRPTPSSQVSPGAQKAQAFPAASNPAKPAGGRSASRSDDSTSSSRNHRIVAAAGARKGVSPTGGANAMAFLAGESTTASEPGSKAVPKKRKQ